MDRFAELTAFCLVASNGGFSAAARQLAVATSSVTRQVDALERRLGTPLLNRSTRSVTLTDSGRAYFEQATQILAALDQADDTAAGDGEPAGLLRVSAPVTLALRYLAPLLPELARRYPRLRLDLRLSDNYVNMADEAIDLAIRIGNPERQPNLVARKLAGHRRHICASPAYLARHGAPATPDALAAHNCLQFSYGDTRHRWHLRRAQQEQIDIEVAGTLSVNNADMLRQAALGGVGLALLADWLVREDLAAGRLVSVLPEYEVNPGEMEVGIYAVYSASRRGSVTIRVLGDLLAAALAD